MHARQKAVSPVSSMKVLTLSDSRNQHDERRKIARFRAQPIREPRSHCRSAGLWITGLKEGDGGVVVDGFGLQRTNKGHIVDDARRPWKQLGNVDARLAVSGKLVFGANAHQRLTLQLGDT